MFTHIVDSSDTRSFFSHFSMRLLNSSRHDVKMNASCPVSCEWDTTVVLRRKRFYGSHSHRIQKRSLFNNFKIAFHIRVDKFVCWQFHKCATRYAHTLKCSMILRKCVGIVAEENIPYSTEALRLKIKIYVNPGFIFCVNIFILRFGFRDHIITWIYKEYIYSNSSDLLYVRIVY